MPGLFGIVGRRPDAGVGRRFDAALVRMQRAGGLTVESAADPGQQWSMGRAHHAVLQPASQGRTRRDRLAWLHGDVTNADDLRRSEGCAPGASIAELVDLLYERYGPAFAARMTGAFVVAVLDQAQRRLMLATDLVGSYPLYWRCDASECLFSSDLTALVAVTNSKPSLDLRAVADYLTIGWVMGDRTLADGVRLLGPGETLVFDWPDGDARITRHSSLAVLFHGERDDRAAYLDEVSAAFAAAVERSVTGNHRYALSLSGGLDSRAILSALNGHAASMTTYTLGIKGCADELIADDLASIAGTNHLFFELSERYLRDYLPNLAQMVSLTDGLYLSHGLTEMLALQFIDQTSSTVLLRGHGGELAKTSLAWPLHTDPTVHGLTDLASLSDYVAKRANYLTPRVSLGDLLIPGLAASAGRGSLDSLPQALAGTALTPAQACGYLYLSEQHRRYTLPSLELFRSRVEVRLPFVDTSFLKALLGGPPEWRDQTDIHRAIVRAGRAALLRVRNSNTGAAADASPTTERLMEKVNTLLKRANVRGFRHYHNFDRWMQSMLLTSVRQELLTPSAHVNSWIRPDALKKLVDDTASGAASHGYLLQAVLLLELWQRENGVTAAV